MFTRRFRTSRRAQPLTGPRTIPTTLEYVSVVAESDTSGGITMEPTGVVECGVEVSFTAASRSPTLWAAV